ncbi:TPA: glycerol-3-phosphate cytidylyltransferase [Patescibacteria group bacterium]|uniref:Glycerol-3-phosphate cytidyltransferase TagD n=1 Tax=Candidatus Gottesmanbacteria bacterium GW2011_GWA1_43_11 TaxID=1618436 RepID=A0A0G1FFD2_9BACT|nr:MAG: glycerol-3-phosphate cytidyltransferase TagD [Candidatus Gottesmanbacteria bacterium GW2011_GWA1_43_11]HCS79249.1 glycerol-3-phosphate cytidylyltransferase [Patescibacteria group bacterium]
MQKIILFPSLEEKIKLIKQTSQNLVLVGGCFDILHLGHVRFLAACKKLGTVIVALESDQTLTTHKGHLRPIHAQSERAEVLCALASVDYVLLLPYLSTHAEYYELTQSVAPQIIAVTEGDPLLTNKQKQAEAVGAKIVVIPKINTPSTTQLAKLLGLEQ